MIRLAVIPVDPRDFFRGDYVILSYGISRLDAGALEGIDRLREQAFRVVLGNQEDRKTEGLMLPMSVRDNLTLAVLDGVSSAGIVRPSRERATVRAAVQRLGIKTRDAGLQAVGTAPVDSRTTSEASTS